MSKKKKTLTSEETRKLWEELKDLQISKSRLIQQDFRGMKYSQEKEERYDGNFSKDQVDGLIRELSNASFDPSPVSPLDWEIVDRGCGRVGLLNKTLDERLFNLDLSSDILKKNRNLPLLKARSALRLGITNDEIYDRAKKAVAALNSVPFSSFIWDESIDLLYKIKGRCKNWPDLAIKAWAICIRKEKEVPLGLQLRLYWSRHNLLYDLAFKAAVSKSPKNLKRAVEIIDSLKSRPTIKWLNIEKSITDKEDKEILEKLYEIESQWALDNYIPDYHEQMQKLHEKKPRVNPERPITSVPAGWAAVHFYLDQDRQGHAITYNADSNKWRHYPFFLQDKSKGIDLWQDYNAWQAFDRYTVDRDAALRNRDFLKTARQAGSYLQKLCHKVGCQLQFLFNDDLPENLILIPHGFLHLVPIHAAMNSNQVLLEKKTCIYLPAWSLAPTDTARKPTNGMGLFINWEKNNTFGEIYDNWPDNLPGDQKYPDATDNDVKEYLNKISIPHLLAILCHGEADPLNPYNSRLVLKRKGLTHGELVQLKNRMEGTRVVLGACESDLAPENQSFIDEHLSLATAFLQKGAVEIAGNLWRVGDTILKELIESVMQNGGESLFNLIRAKQKAWWKNEIEIIINGVKVETITDSATKLYLLSPFRVIGFPEDMRGDK
jgi:hypothetical protein